MSSSTPRDSAGPWPIYVMVALILAAVLLWAAMGYTARNRWNSSSQAVNNARQIYLATFNMANDFEVNSDPHLGWPGDLATRSVDPVHNLSEFAERLVAYDYIKRSDLDKIFGLKGVPRYSGTGPFSGQYSAFKIYLITEQDVADTLFCTTKNFTFGYGLDSAIAPYGDQRFVFVRKGGDALSFLGASANDTPAIGFMPGHKTAADPGEETSGNVWKD